MMRVGCLKRFVSNAHLHIAHRCDGAVLAEIVAEHRGLIVPRLAGRDFLRVRAREPHKLFVVPRHAAGGTHVYLIGAAVRVAHVAHKAVKAFMHLRVHAGIERADGALQHRFPGDDVAPRARVQAAHRDDDGIKRRREPRRDRLKRAHKLAGAHDRVHAQLRHCAMPAKAMNRDGEHIRRRGHAALGHAQLARAIRAPYVHAEKRVHIVHQPRFQHGLRAELALFRRLEDHLHRAAQFRRRAA